MNRAYGIKQKSAAAGLKSGSQFKLRTRIVSRTAQPADVVPPYSKSDILYILSPIILVMLSFHRPTRNRRPRLFCTLA
jgi:hypothetical protein